MQFQDMPETYVDPFTGLTYRLCQDDKSKIIYNLETKLHKAYQELQQLQDETCLEVDEMQLIIDNQQEYIGQLQAQLHNTLERKLQMSFMIDTSRQEAEALKHHLSDACLKNRRLCLELESAELGLQEQRNTNDRLREWARKEIREAKEQAVDGLRRAQAAEKEAADARRSNNCLLDQLQAADAKLESLRQFALFCFPDLRRDEQAAGESVPTPPTVSIDWTTAPDWANYHAFDKPGYGWWYEKEPSIDDDELIWALNGRGGNAKRSECTLPNGADWKQSLTQRPTR